jgi:hypothetical protein
VAHRDEIERPSKCRLLGADQKWLRFVQIDANDPERTSPTWRETEDLHKMSLVVPT